MQWLLIVPLAIIGIWVIGLNYLCAYLAVVKHEHHSLLPLVGGIAGGITLLIYPSDAVRAWAWLPLILDLGCAFTLFSFFYAVIVLKVFHKP